MRMVVVDCVKIAPNNTKVLLCKASWMAASSLFDGF